MSQFGTISRQVSRHNSSTTSSSASMVSATGTYRRAPASSSQFSVPQPHLNGGPTYPQNTSESRSIVREIYGGPKTVWTQFSHNYNIDNATFLKRHLFNIVQPICNAMWVNYDGQTHHSGNFLSINDKWDYWQLANLLTNNLWLFSFLIFSYHNYSQQLSPSTCLYLSFIQWSCFCIFLCLCMNVCMSVCVSSVCCSASSAYGAADASDSPHWLCGQSSGE